MLIQTSQEKQFLIFRYIGRLEGIIEGSDINKERYDDIQRAFDAELADLERSRVAMTASMAASAARKDVVEIPTARRERTNRTTSLDDMEADPFYCIGWIEGVLKSEMYESDLERLESIGKAIEEFDAAQKAHIESLNDDESEGGAE